MLADDEFLKSTIFFVKVKSNTIFHIIQNTVQEELKPHRICFDSDGSDGNDGKTGTAPVANFLSQPSQLSQGPCSAL